MWQRSLGKLGMTATFEICHPELAEGSPVPRFRQKLGKVLLTRSHMKNILIPALLLFSPALLSAAELKSPNGDLTIHVEVENNQLSRTERMSRCSGVPS